MVTIPKASKHYRRLMICHATKRDRHDMKRIINLRNSETTSISVASCSRLKRYTIIQPKFHRSLSIRDVNVSLNRFELHELRGLLWRLPKVSRRAPRSNFAKRIRPRPLVRSKRSIAQTKVNNDSQCSRPASSPADPVPRETFSLTASCNALPVASRSGRAKAGLQARSLVRSLIRKTVGRFDAFEGDRLGVEINHRIKWKC